MLVWFTRNTNPEIIFIYLMWDCQLDPLVLLSGAYLIFAVSYSVGSELDPDPRFDDQKCNV